MEGGVLVGDFNTRPDAPELAALRERFTDAWELAPDRDDQAGWRFWRGDEGDTSPPHSPRKRIDQVWVSAGRGRRRGAGAGRRGRVGPPAARRRPARSAAGLSEDAQAVSSSRSRWLITPVMPSPRMLTP